VTVGAERTKVFALVVFGSNLDLIIHRLANTPLYLPLLSKTAKTGGISPLKSERQTESVSSSLTLIKPLEKTSFTILETIHQHASTSYFYKIQFKQFSVIIYTKNYPQFYCLIKYLLQVTM
jgi:hypothetical protein